MSPDQWEAVPNDLLDTAAVYSPATLTLSSPPKLEFDFSCFFHNFSLNTLTLNLVCILMCFKRSS
jgi:hypothetical protein